MANRMISYGYGIKGERLCVVEKEAEIVKRIFSEYTEGKLLQDIADELTQEQIEFFMGNCVWNKNRIARIIDNEKYIGADGYPQIINDDDFAYVKQLKEKKGAKKIHFDEITEYLRNNKIICSQCGAPMRRISKWRSREKWLCRQGCGNEIYVSDNVVFGGISSILYQISQNPDCVRPIKEDKKPDLEIRRRMSEINRLLSSSNPSFSVGKKMIFSLAELKFESGNNKTPDIYTDMLIDETPEELMKERVSKDFAEKYFDKIYVDEQGYVKIRFINGVELTNKTEADTCNKV